MFLSHPPPPRARATNLSQYCYWTGYYSSRPGLKRLERATSGYLQAARQLQALAGAGAGGGGGGGGRTREAAAELESLAALEVRE